MGKIFDENGIPQKGYPQKVLNLVPISVEEMLKEELSESNRAFLMSEEGSKIKLMRHIEEIPTHLKEGTISNPQT